VERGLWPWTFAQSHGAAHEAKEKLTRCGCRSTREARGAASRPELAERDYACGGRSCRRNKGSTGGSGAIRIELANLELERQQAIIRAPIDGMVTTGDVKVGDLLERGKSVVEIAAQQGFRFEAVVLSEEMSHCGSGCQRGSSSMPTTTALWHGGGDGSLHCSDSGVPAGQHTVTYLVKIQLAGKSWARRVPWPCQARDGRPSGDCDGQERLLTLLVKKIRQTISLG